MIEPDVPADYGPATYGDAFADVYDDWYADISDVEATVDAITRLSGGEPVLELGIGTGRLALPLAARGIPVVGVDASQAMLDLLAAKPGSDTIATVLADMAELPIGDKTETLNACGPYAVAFAAFNTFFNLTTDEAQNACLRALFDLVRPDGLVVIEGFVPPPGGLDDGRFGSGHHARRGGAHGLQARRRTPGHPRPPCRDHQRGESAPPVDAPLPNARATRHGRNGGWFRSRHQMDGLGRYAVPYPRRSERVG